MPHPIHVGVGGWSFERWDETFYPAGLPKARQMDYMSRKMTAVEVNATYYSSFKPDTFAKWREASPDGFMFCLKAHRFCTVRKTREDMETSVGMFVSQGIAQLKEKLGPINWQFPATRKFDVGYFETFLSVLPREIGGIPLRHVLEVRNPSCDDPAFLDLLTKHGATVVYAEDDEFPLIRHAAGDLAYVRLMCSQTDEPAGYPAADIERFAKTFKGWSRKQEVFAFFISGAKEHNPAAAMALQAKLGITPASAGEAEALVSRKTAAGATSGTPAGGVRDRRKRS